MNESSNWSELVQYSHLLETRQTLNPYSAKGLGDRLYATQHKMPGEVDYSFCLFFNWKTLPYTHLEVTSYIPLQGQSLHFWTTSLFTTGCYRTKYTIQFLWMACINRFATAILSGETELALGTIRAKTTDRTFKEGVNKIPNRPFPW